MFLEEDFNNSLVERWMQINDHSSKKELDIIATTCWAIWSDRNKAIHGEAIPPARIRGQWIQKCLQDYQKANERSVSEKAPNYGEDVSARKSGQLERQTLENGMCKILVDAAWTGNPPATGIGVICFNWNGDPVGASASFRNLDFNPLLQN